MLLKLNYFIPYQGRIYVANDYPTNARTILIVNQKLQISGQIIFE